MKIVFRYIAIAVTSLIALLSSSSCASGSNANAETTETRTVRISDFTEIDAASGIKVVYTQGQLSPAKLTAPASLIDRVEIKQKGKKLKVRVNRKNSPFQSFKGGKVVLQVSSGMLTEIDTSSGAEVRIDNGLTVTSTLEADASSGSAIIIKGIIAHTLDCGTSSGASIDVSDIKVKNVKADSSSGSGIKLAGTCVSIDAEASSGASVNAKALVAEKGDGEASSGASVRINARNCTLDKNSGGSAKNVYKN